MDEARIKKIRKSFGERIRKLRKEKGFSQENFAYECGLHRTYMGDVERGERNISIDNIIKIAHALGIAISDLFDGIK
ncbi:MAG TPA: helix-turn-helix transcriptional regulator [Rickettsiales bacterium]|nr:helix-turn-helix transcriptional regulator [Rickettsiales bacterium]